MASLTPRGAVELHSKSPFARKIKAAIHKHVFTWKMAASTCAFFGVIGVNPAGDAGDISPPIFWLVGTSMGMSPPIFGVAM